MASWSMDLPVLKASLAACARLRVEFCRTATTGTPHYCILCYDIFGFLVAK
jgi:hypothetical protein